MSKKVTTLGMIADIITGPFGSQLHMSDYVDEGIPVIMPQNIGNRIVIENGIAKISEENYKRLIKYAVHKDDLVFSRRGDVEKHAFISKSEQALCGTGCLRVRIKCDKVYPLFLSFFLSRYETKKWLTSHAVGSNMPNINTEILSTVPVELPDYETQVKIADILQLLDSKILSNCAVCDSLEQMARTIYDYWFLQFDFPDESGNPYRQSGGKMVWNEELKREIPEGWSVETINEMTTSNRGVTYNKEDLLSDSQVGVLVLRGNNIQNNRLVYDNNVAYVANTLVAEEQRIRAHDIIFTMSSGSKEHIGKCVMFQFDSPHTYGAFLTKFTPKKDKEYYVYLSMISKFFKKKIEAICNGTGINNLTKETFDNISFPIPRSSILSSFEKIVAPMFNRIGDCELENEELVKLRDFLLPILMNGQAKVR